MATVLEAVRLIEEAEERLSRAKAALAPIAGPTASAGWPGGRILADVLKEGGSVTRERLYELAAKHGMDRRGLGGFFRASGKGSLYEIPGMNRVLLTPAGTELARRAIEEDETMYPVSEAAAFAKVAEPSFAEDWESDEDSIYDRL